MSIKVPKHYYNNDPTSFAFKTCQERWPVIVQNAVDDVTSELNKFNSKEAKEQGKIIVAQLKDLKQKLINDAKIEPFNEPNVPSLNSYDETLQKLPESEITWLTGPWLYLECYLYRLINLFFLKQSHWSDFDVFENLKRETFKSSTFGIYELAIQYREFKKQLDARKPNLDSLELLFREFVDICLWGNATDLSLLANATLEDIKSVQGAEARKKSEKNILANDLDQAWQQLLSIQKNDQKRVDFVLDNAGFENYTDLILSLFLLDTGMVNTVVFHCKTRPWMVSDTMIKDVHLLLSDLQNLEWFPEHRIDLDFLVSEISTHLKNGKIILKESEFWTLDLDYWNISPLETKYGGNLIHKELLHSDLVIIKGDLNYRKLTGDRQWDRSTPFTVAIDGLNKSGLKLFALRTCKADVCCGLPKGKNEELCEYWRSLGNEVGELWCSSGKWAVISYSDGNGA
ncbi:hypothetical protein PACTADRAFT_184830 [Pachysolen tannophilus NRRL Y-2460]|uniref:Sugar phosphate phosphatase n=1 Tax=Pachysolen tannophilus NRRL Y-2460 TaxID=669874 RepID=A0A1E4U3K9_PACTA|nr:hypothetical protein PACTADRAFT_184830 [Pachysolen tannophilus NRRL Y-2460]